jgi:phage gpG-like protein
MTPSEACRKSRLDAMRRTVPDNLECEALYRYVSRTYGQHLAAIVTAEVFRRMHDLGWLGAMHVGAHLSKRPRMRYFVSLAREVIRSQKLHRGCWSTAALS